MKKIISRNKLFLVIGVILIISLVFILINKSNLNISGKATTQLKSSGTSQPVIITNENFAQHFEKQQILKDLPKKAVILLKFYDYVEGERVWEDSYIIRESSVILGETNEADLEISLHSKYFSELGSFCKTIKLAKANGEMGFELKISKTKFLWRYKGMTGYRDCLGF